MKFMIENCYMWSTLDSSYKIYYSFEPSLAMRSFSMRFSV